MRILVRGEPGYPALLEHIPSPPELLYVLGDAALLSAPAVAVVGSRRPTREGVLFTETLAADLASRGVTVVSGLAYGIDAAAHRGALSTGRTVAVLASGVDVPSPGGNRELYRRILDTGAVASEFAPGTKARAWHFLQRNRIISGLALGTVVVEAAERSGALITARHATEQNRELFAVPGSPLRDTSAGPNALLKDGAALVRDCDDVVRELGPRLEAAGLDLGQAPADPAAGGPASPAILAHVGRVPKHLDELLAEIGGGLPRLLAELSELEILGLVRQMPGKYFARADRTSRCRVRLERRR